uniref:Ribosomal protein S10 n=1 Tax=Pyramimonas parkeae TaxID=36894 RepID=A0A1D8I1U4_9CHLO|nr:ribosomal protein S10 [Pyramimonas parkeae]AOT98954.1 ribosomal protein S10 [Pyramimonas parkeae]
MHSLSLRRNEIEAERNYHLNFTYRSFDKYQLKKAIFQTNIIYNRYFGRSNKIKIIPLPRLKTGFTILRSPHVHKKSREQFTNITFQNVLSKSSKQHLFYLDNKKWVNFEKLKLFFLAIKSLEMQGVQIQLEFSWRN